MSNVICHQHLLVPRTEEYKIAVEVNKKTFS